MTDTTQDTAADVTEGEVDTSAEAESTTLLTEGADQQTEATADAEADADKPTDEKSAGAPEQYEDFTFPDGVVVDEEALGDFKNVAKELNLDQAGAQKVAEIGAKLAANWANQAQAQFQATLDTWVSEVKADKEIGGEALPENLAAAKRALAVYGTPALQTLFNESGFGNNPEVIRFAYRVGKTLKEDTVVTGRENTSVPDAGSVLYDNPTSKT